MFQVASRTYNMCLILTQPSNDQTPVGCIIGVHVAMVTDTADVEEHSRESDWTDVLC